MDFFGELFEALDKGGEELFDAILESNPELGARVAIDELKDLIEQDVEALRLLKVQLSQHEQRIISLAQSIKELTGKSKMAEEKGRQDLVDGATKRIEQLMVEGNSAWNLRLSCEKRIENLTKALQEKRDKLNALQGNGAQSVTSGYTDLDDEFTRFEEAIKDMEPQQDS